LALISQLTLSNFRSFVNLSIDLPPGIVVLYGDNAQGKTTILEAIYLLAIARSFRAENEREVINFEAGILGQQALVGGNILKREGTLSVMVGYQSSVLSDHESRYANHVPNKLGYSVRKQIRVNKLHRTASQLVGSVSAVLFSAEDIDLVYGPPAGRRKYLDILISQSDPAYVSCLQRYQKIVQNRNRLLKMIREGRSDSGEMEFWDEQLVREGSSIIYKRSQTIRVLSNLCFNHYVSLNGGHRDFRIEYKPSVIVGLDIEETCRSFVSSIDELRQREISSATTLMGPHRDDFILMDGNLDLGTFSSRGEARTLALTLRLGEAEYLYAVREDPPIVLLDDVLSEMDKQRRERVMTKLSGYPQSIITTTDDQIIREFFGAGASYLHVQNGEVAP
jgi:DNA replication and repair protein RecF